MAKPKNKTAMTWHAGRCLAAAAVLSLALAAPARAQATHEAAHEAAAPAASPAAAAVEKVARLPGNAVTHHSIVLPGRTLHFTATTGAVTLTNDAGAAQAQISFISYALDDQPPEHRPISFAMNGGPGTASAWVDLGLTGPWRVAMTPEQARPSAPAVAVENADTWLDFTDLVYIDPIGTGFSKLLLVNDDNKKKYWSVDGDVASIAQAIRRVLVETKRMASPKYIIGESYSGLRGPKLVRVLEDQENVGISGLTLVSPKLDYGGRSNALDPLSWAAVLPSEAASFRAKSGPVARADMADVEAYASGEYVTDLLRGDDPLATARRVAHIAAFTGLDRALVERRHGFVHNFEFLRERNHDSAEVSSAYDSTVTKADPAPNEAFSQHIDPMIDALQPAFVSALLDIYARKLNWMPDAAYVMSNMQAFHAWQFGNAYIKPESVTALRRSLATDPQFRVLIGHGLFDVVTPYFDTQMMLNQIPRSVGADRVTLEVYPGGHMFYSRDDSRAAFRAAAQKLYDVH